MHTVHELNKRIFRTKLNIFNFGRHDEILILFNSKSDEHNFIRSLDLQGSPSVESHRHGTNYLFLYNDVRFYTAVVHSALFDLQTIYSFSNILCEPVLMEEAKKVMLKGERLEDALLRILTSKQGKEVEAQTGGTFENKVVEVIWDEDDSIDDFLNSFSIRRQESGN